MSIIFRPLPNELRTDLPNAHGTGAGNATEAGTADVAARIQELRVVEYVEEFTPDLERLGFRDRYRLLQPQIGVVDTRPMEEPPVGRPKASALTAQNARAAENAGSRHECAGIKVGVVGGVARIHDVNRPHQIWHIGGRASGK